VNGDSHPDIVAVTPTAVYVRFGAAGGLGATMRRVHGGDLKNIAIARLDGNDRPDLVIADHAAGRVLVSYDFGNGDLQVDETHTGTPEPVDDCDGYHCYDCSSGLFCDIYTDPTSMLLGRVYPSAGGGLAATSFLVVDAKQLALGDVDGIDGADLVSVTGQGPTALLSVRRNDGAGLLLPAIQSVCGLEDAELGPLVPASITTADLNGDHLMDVVVGTTQGRLVAALATGGGHFGQATPVPGTGTSTGSRLRTVDWDRDGHTDIASTDASGSRYSVAWGNGDGTFGSGGVLQAVEPLTMSAHDVAFADFDGDGDLDVAVGTGTSVVVQFGNP
jgi:hypothetical protein